MSSALVRLRARLTYANVVATLALFLALGGATAIAIEKLPRRSVGAPQLRPGAVTAGKLRKSAVTTPKIAARAVTSPKLVGGAVTGAILAPGSVASDKIVPGAITHEKIGVEAITGDQVIESSLGQVPSAARADLATTADSANPVAFAEVDEVGTLNPNHSKGLTPADVTKSGTGVYCINTPGFIARGAQVTPRYENEGDVTAYVKVGPNTCTFPRVEVATYKAGLASNERFYVVLYR
jgi:hypothetical protein